MLASVLLVANLAMLVIYLFGSYRGYFHTDAAVKNLLAQEMHETSSFFPSTWNYVNKDLMVLFGQLGVWPLLFFTDNSYTAYAISGVAFALLILASVWWFTGLLGGATWQRLLGLAVLAGGISSQVAEDNFGQAAYGVVLMFTCLITVLAWRTIESVGRPRLRWSLLLMVLVCLITWSNPQRAAASYLLPLACGLITFVCSEEWRQRIRPMSVVMGSALVGFAVGALLSASTLVGVNNVAGAGQARWLTFDGMVSNFYHALQGVIALLGGLPVATTDVLTVSGAYAAVRLVAALILTVLIGRRIVSLFASSNGKARFIGGLVGGLALCFLFLQVTTTVPDMSDPIRSARYLDPVVIMGLMLVLCSSYQQLPRWASVLVVSLGLLLATNSAARFSPDSLIYAGRNNIQRDALVAELRAMGLRYGYASYWNAGALTVLSAGDVLVRQVDIYGGLPVPKRHLASDRWYEPEAWQGETFMLLEPKEVAALDWATLTRYAGPPIREADVGGLKVFVFKRNLSAVLPNWSGQLREPLRMMAAPGSAHVVGHWNDAERTLETNNGEAGFVQFGPYRVLDRGRYRATFEVTGRSAPADQVVAKVDASTSNGSIVLGAAEVKGDGAGMHAFEFVLDQRVSDLELRVWTTGTGTVAYRSVTLSPVP